MSDLEKSVATLTRGDVTVSALNEGAGLFAVDLIDSKRRPITAAEGQAEELIGFHVFHIATRDLSILVDAGFDDPESEWGRRFASEWPGVVRTQGLEKMLAGIGEDLASIDCVVITHAHFDHVAGLTADRNGKRAPRFPNARVYVSQQDWDVARSGDPAGPDIRSRLETIRNHGLLRPVEEAEVEITPGVTMVHTGGESPGHSVIWIESKGERFLAAGDLFHFTREIEHPEWMSPWVARKPMWDAREKLLRRTAETGAVMAFTHHAFPPWGRVNRTGQGYSWTRFRPPEPMG